MTYLTSWEEFAKAAERLYLNDPQKVTFTSMQCSFRKHKHDKYIYIPWPSKNVYFKYIKSRVLIVICRYIVCILTLTSTAHD